MTLQNGRLWEYLDHMDQAIARIALYLQGKDKTEFLDSELLQDAVIRNLEIIGEASRNIMKRYPDFAAEYPELPLKAAYEMRNALSHGYFQVDLDAVWLTIVRDLPAVSAQIAQMRYDRCEKER